jgi:hypothetical protein
VEEPRSWLGCNNMCSLKLRAIGGEMFRGMVLANTAKVMRTMNLVVFISVAIVASHPGVVNSIVVIKGFF